MAKRTKPIDSPIPGGIDPDTGARWNAELPPAEKDRHPTRPPKGPKPGTEHPPGKQP